MTFLDSLNCSGSSRLTSFTLDRVESWTDLLHFVRTEITWLNRLYSTLDRAELRRNWPLDLDFYGNCVNRCDVAITSTVIVVCLGVPNGTLYARQTIKLLCHCRDFMMDMMHSTCEFILFTSVWTYVMILRCSILWDHTLLSFGVIATIQSCTWLSNLLSL